MDSAAKMVLKGSRVKDGVEYILRKYPQAKGDYRILDWRFCQEFTGVRISFSQFSKLRSAPSFETIHRRYRELVQNQPELDCKPKTRNKRNLLAQAFHNHYSRGLTLEDFIPIEG